MKPLIPGEDYYYTPQRLMVFTRKYHLERGYCCGIGCRECPFEHECVPEPRKSALDQEKNPASGNTSPQTG